MDTCTDFLLAIFNAEQQQSSSDIFVIGERIFSGEETLERVNALAAYERCKANGWLMGATEGAWLTSVGKRQIGKA